MCYFIEQQTRGFEHSTAGDVDVSHFPGSGVPCLFSHTSTLSHVVGHLLIPWLNMPSLPVVTANNTTSMTSPSAARITVDIGSP